LSRRLLRLHGRSLLRGDHLKYGRGGAHHGGELRRLIDDLVPGAAVQREGEDRQWDEGHAQMQGQGDGAEQAHQCPGDGRAGSGTDAVQEQHAGVASKDLVLVQVVDQVRDHDRIDGECRATE
ncbi:hypothetical protein RZS08_39420, partial [Arthrospira platensis SPKY1]|nr:hypothetical protein [Arthrospira platensis SPKY1]